MRERPINPVDVVRSPQLHARTRTPRRDPVAWWRPAFLATGIAAVLVVVFTSDVRAVLTTIHDGVESLGPWGPIAFVAIFVAWVVLALPGSWLGAMAGALWGTAVGFPVAMVGATVGAAACFLIARYFARQPIRRLAARSDRFCRLDRLTRRHGAIIVIVVRLIPIFPYNVTNYAFGLTGVRFWTYLFWSFVCMIPGTLFLVATADAVAQGVSTGEVPGVLITVALTSLLILAVLIMLSRRQLRRSEARLADETVDEDCEETA